MATFHDAIKIIEDDSPPLDTSDEAYEREEREERAWEESEKRRGKQKLSEPDKDKDEDRRAINYLYVGKGLWYWLRKASNDNGMKMERFIVHLLDTARKTWKPPSEDSPMEVQINYLRHQSDAETDAYEDAFALALNYKKHPNDENRARLRIVCDRLGTSPSDLLERIEEDTFAEMAAEYNNDPDTKINRCVKRMIEYCRLREGQSIPSHIFNEAMQEAGYNRQMVYAARRKLGLKGKQINGVYNIVIPKGTSVLHGEVK